VPKQSPISFQVRTKNVLIVDGNEAMQQLRDRVLRSRGVHVHTAKALHALRSTSQTSHCYRIAVRLPRSTRRCCAIPFLGSPCVHVSPAVLFVLVIQK
jgi:CheY-like chemotaxis protein